MRLFSIFYSLWENILDSMSRKYNVQIGIMMCALKSFFSVSTLILLVIHSSPSRIVSGRKPTLCGTLEC